MIYLQKKSNTAPQTDWNSFKGGYSAQSSKAASSKQQANAKSNKSTSKKATSSKSAGKGQKKEEKMKVDEVSSSLLEACMNAHDLLDSIV